MDKETLSNYGWIVVLVLILAVMLALATPFGTFIAGAIKSTTAGLFSVNQAALGSAGIDVNDMVFENCDHVETEIRNATDTYTGDTCCKACGTVLQAGQTVRAKVPEGGKYTAADGTVYNPGDEMPEPTTGDTYEYHWYIYKYNQRLKSLSTWETVELQNGWGVGTKSIGGVTDWGEMLSSINGKPIVSLNYTFYSSSYMTVTPAIPDTVTEMAYTFYGTKITKAPIIPEGVTNIERCFQSCTSLTNEGLPIIPSTVTNMKGTFSGCSLLTNIDSIKIPAGVTSIESTFAACGAIDATNFIIPNTVTDMSYTFAYGKIVKAPKIPNGVTTMLYTFDGCSSLVGVPDLSEATALTNMRGTFRSCTALSDASKLVIPSNVETIDGAFVSCTGLLVGPDLTKATGLTDMGMAFSGCTSLKSMPEIPSNVKRMERTFWNCKSLTTVSTLPNGVTNLSYAFQNCTSLADLSTLVIPSSLTSMYATFSGCTSLTKAPIIPSTVLNKNELFKDCTSLTGTITLNCAPANSSSIFTGVDFEAQNLTLIGSYADTFGATGTNYCAECNGKCQGNH